MKKLLLLCTIITVLVCGGCSKKDNIQTILNESLSEDVSQLAGNTSVQEYFSKGVLTYNYEMVKWAIENGADVNKLVVGDDYIAYENQSPLSASIENRSEDIAMLLIKNGVDVNFADEEGVTPLMLAAGEGMVDVCDTLIYKGIDANASDNYGDNAIDYAITFMGDSNLGDKEMIKLVKNLYNNGVKVSKNTKRYIVMSKGDNAIDYEYEALNWLLSVGEIKNEDLNSNQKIFYNVYLGNLDYIKKISTSKLKVKNSNNQDLLMVAAKYGQNDIVKYLLKRGLQFKNEDGSLNNAITYAVVCGDLDTLKTLFKKSNLSDDDIYRTICYSTDISNDEYTEGISYLTDQMSSVNKYIDMPNETILDMAVYNSLENTAKMLIKKGVNISIDTIYSAAYNNNTDLVKLLVENFDLQSVSKEQRQELLSLSVQYGNYELAKYLMDKGITLNSESKEYLKNCPIEKLKSLLED